MYAHVTVSTWLYQVLTSFNQLAAEDQSSGASGTGIVHLQIHAIRIRMACFHTINIYWKAWLRPPLIIIKIGNKTWIHAHTKMQHSYHWPVNVHREILRGYIFNIAMKNINVNSPDVHCKLGCRSCQADRAPSVHRLCHLYTTHGGVEYMHYSL